MNISDKVTQHELLVILLDVCQNVRDTKNIQIHAVVADLEKRLNVVMESNRE